MPSVWLGLFVVLVRSCFVAPVLSQHPRVTYVEFEYRQPVDPIEHGVTWLDAEAEGMVRLGHGTYWECAGSIMSSGALSPSDRDDRYGEREYHGTEGVYLTEVFTAFGEHYAWPCNVFGNKCFYGICFYVLANPAYMKKARPDHRPGVNAVLPEGLLKKNSF